MVSPCTGNHRTCNKTCGTGDTCDHCYSRGDYYDCYEIIYYSAPEPIDMSQFKQAKQYFDKPIDDRPVMIPIPILPTNRRLSQLRRFHNR
jgi:hypothetical protein